MDMVILSANSWRITAPTQHNLLPSSTFLGVDIKRNLLEVQDCQTRAMRLVGSQQIGITMSLRNINKIKKPSNYSFSFTINNPLYEPPGVTFDQYLEHTPRVLTALFKDEKNIQLDEENWKVRVPPMQVLLLTVQPVVEMNVKCKSPASGYPPEVPMNTAKFLEFSTSKCELEGLDMKPIHFNFDFRGVLYPDRQRKQHRLKGNLNMSITYSLPPALSLIPENVISRVFQEGLKNMVGYMNKNLLADFDKFKMEQRQNKL